MLRAHRQAWAWQDEWVDMTIDDIRRLEAETAVYLQTVMKSEEEGVEAEEPTLVETSSPAVVSALRCEESAEDDRASSSSDSSDVFYDCVEASSPMTRKSPPPLIRWNSELIGDENAPSPPLTPRRDRQTALLLLVFHGELTAEA